MCASRGTKFSLMKVAVSSSLYDSASSRAQAPQAGAALKSISTGRLLVFASASAASASVIQLTFIDVSSLRGIFQKFNPFRSQSQIARPSLSRNAPVPSAVMCELTAFHDPFLCTRTSVYW